MGACSGDVGHRHAALDPGWLDLQQFYAAIFLVDIDDNELTFTACHHDALAYLDGQRLL